MEYLVRFLHQTTTNGFMFPSKSGCISSVSYIKPQLSGDLRLRRYGCISSVSYIKPQHCVCPTTKARGCISSVSYIKPQLEPKLPISSIVVYRPFPTSNHNTATVISYFFRLYIVRFLHQTTTISHKASHTVELYIVRFLHQTTTDPSIKKEFLKLYIVRFLHQTTTRND